MTISKIPKIIHFCWFGNNEYPDVVTKCMDSWRKMLPEWEIMLWNEVNSPIDIAHPYLIKALKDKEFAFASDYTRCFALYNFGGVYFDTDIEVIKDFEPLMNYHGFLAPENFAEDLYNVAVLGMEKNNIFCKDMMDYFNSLTGFEPIPDVVSKLIKTKNYQLEILGRESFYPYNPFDHDQKVKQLFFSDISQQTYAIHHWFGSWKPKFTARIKNLVKRITKSRKI